MAAGSTGAPGELSDGEPETGVSLRCVMYGVPRGGSKMIRIVETITAVHGRTSRAAGQARVHAGRVSVVTPRPHSSSQVERNDRITLVSAEPPPVKWSELVSSPDGPVGRHRGPRPVSWQLGPHQRGDRACPSRPQ